MKPCAYVKILEGKEIGDSLGLGGWDLKWRESCGIEPLSQAVSIRTALNCKTSTAGVHQELENWLVSEELWIKEKAFPFISHLLFKVASNELPHMFLFESKDLMNITVCWAQITWSGCNHDLDRVPIFHDHWYHNLTWGYRQKPLIKKKSGYGENTRCPSTEEWLSKLYVHKMEYCSAKKLWIIDTHKSMNQSQKVMLGERSQTPKSTLCYSISMPFKASGANLWWQTLEPVVPAEGGEPSGERECSLLHGAYTFVETHLIMLFKSVNLCILL